MSSHIRTNQLKAGDRVRYARGTAQVAHIEHMLDDICLYLVTLRTPARTLLIVRDAFHEWELAA